MENRLLIEAQYLPPIAYFTLLASHTAVTVEKYEHYQKQTYRNRCYIQTTNGVMPLIIPLIHSGSASIITDMRIDYSQKWLNNHWRTIRSAYGKAPFFEYYEMDLHNTLFKRFAFLYDLNINLLEMCLRWLKYNIQLSETTTYEKTPGTGITDYRSAINPKKPDSCNSFFKMVEYQQVFGNKFVGNLSIIDLIFCEGPGASDVIQTSSLKLNK
jgi:hypothetical protein